MGLFFEKIESPTPEPDGLIIRGLDSGFAQARAPE
jgi:hypothetical protein